MDQSHDTPSFPNPTRRDGWTPELKARFLANLAENGNARLAARRCGMSAQSAYVQRRRDPEFARAWAAAMRLAREHCAQVLADRALEGVEEPIWYRGELVGTRRRYDNRLLLAHMARLDRLERDEQAEADTGRFDEMLALIAGDKLTGALIRGADFVPRDRHQHGVAALQAACEALALEPPPADGDKVDAHNRAQLAQLYALRDARLEWDAWRDRANATADRVMSDPVQAETQGEVDTLTQSWGANPEPARATESPASSLTLADDCANGPPRPVALPPIIRPRQLVPGLPGLISSLDGEKSLFRSLALQSVAPFVLRHAPSPIDGLARAALCDADNVAGR